jgi:hypothetical protein
MKRWIDNNKNHKDKMKRFFKNAKKLLKEHYEKIHKMLENGWNADTQALEKLEKIELEMYEANKKTIQ